ncbi:golgin subfamily B member 1-like [Carlito syrichta]|uniref:Golgin subfamily B member 1-like n=1 Tax=Carlito syrichta TaxID=1868482 RepID=A0A3Q0DGH5_CARSF|nr:golgin subfamily B member 1-like [Carlito syrichta]
MSALRWLSSPLRCPSGGNGRAPYEEQAAILGSAAPGESPQKSDMEFTTTAQQDVLEHLAYAEQLVVSLKDVIRQKDDQLQQKDDAFQGSTEMEEFVMLKQQLQEKEELKPSSVRHRQSNLHRYQQIEAEHILKNTVEGEKQKSKILKKKMELEVVERKLSFHNPWEEMKHLLEQSEKGGQAQAELDPWYRSLEKHQAEREEKNTHIMSLQQAGQELHTACDALRDENSKLLQDKHHLSIQCEKAIQSAQALQHLEDQLQEKSKEISQPVSKPILQQHEIASQTSFLYIYNEGTQLEELKNMQQQYLQINQEITELCPLKQQVKERQDKAKTFQIMQEELRQENLSWQQELHQTRLEHNQWDSPQTPVIGSCGTQEQAVITDTISNSCQRIFLANPECYCMEASFAFTLPFLDPRATASSHLLSDDSCPTQSMLPRSPLDLVFTFWTTPLKPFLTFNIRTINSNGTVFSLTGLHSNSPQKVSAKPEVALRTGLIFVQILQGPDLLWFCKR